jgi:hypothetical protein
MDAAGDDTVVPEAPKDLTPRGWLDFEAGYITRVIDQLPKQGDRDPWQNKQDYKFDRKTLLSSAVDHECLIYKSSKSKAAA